MKSAFDCTQAFEEAVAEVSEAIPALREHVECEFGKASMAERGLTDRDVDRFWKAARAATRVLRSP